MIISNSAPFPGTQRAATPPRWRWATVPDDVQPEPAPRHLAVALGDGAEIFVEQVRGVLSGKACTVVADHEVRRARRLS